LEMEACSKALAVLSSDGGALSDAVDVRLRLLAVVSCLNICGSIAESGECTPELRFTYQTADHIRIHH